MSSYHEYEHKIKVEFMCVIIYSFMSLYIFAHYKILSSSFIICSFLFDKKKALEWNKGEYITELFLGDLFFT